MMKGEGFTSPGINLTQPRGVVALTYSEGVVEWCCQLAVLLSYTSVAVQGEICKDVL